MYPDQLIGRFWIVLIGCTVPSIVHRKIPSVHRMVLYIDTLQFIGCYCADLTVIFHGSYDGIV